MDRSRRIAPHLPLPPRRFLPGRGAARPVLAPTSSVREALAYGADLFERGFAWEAHEVFERAWHPLPAGPARTAVQGLVQAAASIVLRELGREEAARRIAARAARRLREGALPRDLDPGLDLEALAERLADGRGGAPGLVR